MTMAKKPESPNKDIDDAIRALMAKVKADGLMDESVPPDVAVKIIATAISWEKVKHHIRDSDTFNPDDL